MYSRHNTEKSHQEGPNINDVMSKSKMREDSQQILDQLDGLKNDPYKRSAAQSAPFI